MGIVYLAPREGKPPDDPWPDVVFAEKVGSDWSATVVGKGRGTPNIVRGGLRYDISSQPHVAYNLGYNGAMCYATRSAGIWATEEVYYTSWGDYDGILRLDSIGQPVIAFFDWMFDGKLSWRVDGTWQTENAPWGWRQEHNFALDASNNVRALRYDWSYSAQTRQYYYERDATTGAWWQDADWPWFSSGGGLLNIEVDANNLTHFAINTKDGRLIYGVEIPEPEIDVSPLAYDFGDVPLASSSTTIVTITNTGGGFLTVGSIGFQVGSSVDFSITLTPSMPAIVGPDESVDIGIAYSPLTVGYASAVLEITSNDRDEGLVQVALGGVGVKAELPPEEQIAQILDFFDMSVDEGTLAGDGPGSSAKGRLKALRNMIEAAGDLIEDGLIEEPCEQLLDAYNRTDGQPRPPDFTKGTAAPVLAGMIDDLRVSLGCE